MKSRWMSVILSLVVCVAAAAADNTDAVKPSAVSKIALDQSFGPQPGYTLAGNFSKMKTYLEAQFGVTVSAHAGGWSYAALQNYDVLIIPTRFTARPSGSDLDGLKTFMQQGGCVIILWYSLCELGCTGNPDPPANWPGTGLHDTVLDSFAGIQVKSAYPGSHNFTSFQEGFGTTPFAVSTVNSAKSAWFHQVVGSAKFIAQAGGYNVAAYNPSLGSGKLFVIGSLTAFQNAYIDTGGNKNFLFNIISKCGASGGGGGLTLMNCKGKPLVLAPGADIKCTSKVKNKGAAAAAASTVEFYLSTDTTLGGDTFLGTAAVPALAPNAAKKVVLTAEVPMLADGFYYVIAKLPDGSTKASKKKVEIR